MAFTVSGNGTLAPFTIGHAFKQGDFPEDVLTDLATADVVVKNRWPDGSAKFGIVAGRVTLSGAKSIALSAGTVPPGAALTTADLKSTGIVAGIGCGSFGSVQWAAGDWDQPFQTWVSSASMSSWIYRKPIGSDAHLVGWLEVRLYAGGSVEVLPYIENGYLKVPSPTNRSSTYSFTLGGTRRFNAVIDLPHHCRTPLLNGTTLSHWLGTDPSITVKHDVAYMQATELVPSYRATADASIWSTDRATVGVEKPVLSFTPLEVGNYWSPMGAGAYHPDIGILPEWDVLYLTSTDVRAWAYPQMQAFRAGRYPIHFRDESTNRPIRFSSYPSLVIGNASGVSGTGASTIDDYTPTTSGTTPDSWDLPHHPSIGFMAYLMTGRMYFLEELQFATTTNFLINSNNNRQTTAGIIQSGAYANTTRGAGWALRTLFQAAAITPDADVLATEFLSSTKANIDFYHARYVAQTNNPFGIVATPVNYAAVAGRPGFEEAPWQQHFFTAALGYGLALQPNIVGGLTKFSEFFAWKAKFSVGILGGTASTDWNYQDANVYTMVISTSATPDWSGAAPWWFSDWGAMYMATKGSANPGTSGTLSNPTATAYWGNLQPGIAYAVRHGVTGAQAAYDRMTRASNWPSFIETMNQNPVWSVRPGPTTSVRAAAAVAGTVPAWRQGQGLNEWRAIAGSAMVNFPPSVSGVGDVTSKMDAWCGLSIDTRTNDVYSVANGGHGDYYGNEVDRFTLGADSPRWNELLPSNTLAQISRPTSGARYSSGRPASSHSYYSQQYIEKRNRAMRFGLGSVADIGNGAPVIDGFDTTVAPGIEGWDGPSTYPNLPAFSPDLPVCKNTITEDVYIFNQNLAVYEWTQSTNTIATVSTAMPGSFNYAASAFDSSRGRILLLSGAPASICQTFDVSTNTFTPRTLTGSFVAQVMANQQSMIYEAWGDRFLVRAAAGGGAVYAVDAGTFATSMLSTTGGGLIPLAGTSGGVANRMLFAPSLGGIVYFPNYRSNAWFLRTR